MSWILCAYASISRRPVWHQQIIHRSHTFLFVLHLVAKQARHWLAADIHKNCDSNYYY
jgi:hypothetical protein